MLLKNPRLPGSPGVLGMLLLEAKHSFEVSNSSMLALWMILKHASKNSISIAFWVNSDFCCLTLLLPYFTRPSVQRTFGVFLASRFCREAASA